MTWLWLICFSAAVSAFAASVEGQVELVDSREAAVRKNRDYSGVVIWLEPIGRELELPVPKKFVHFKAS